MKKRVLDSINVVIPRLSDIHFNFGMLCLKHLEKMGIPMVNSYESIELCKNKYLTSIILEKKRIPQPNSAIALSSQDMLEYVKHLPKPLVFKLLNNSYGIGVSKINDEREAEDWLETMGALHQPIYIQEFIDHKGEDYRIFVIDGTVKGMIKRIANKGQWKTNIHKGATSEKANNKELKEIALKCAHSLKVDVCGVDIAYNKDQPKVIEVNQFANFKGLESATKKNIAGEIVKFAKKIAKR